MLVECCLLSVVRPSLEYGNEIWDCNKSQANALESVILGRFWDVHLEHVMRLLEGTWA